VLEKRNIRNTSEVLWSIQLDEKVNDSAVKQMVLSNDGSVCAIAGGQGKPYFYVIDVENQLQQKITSDIQASVYAPCFINGATELFAVGRYGKFVEVWDLGTQKAIKRLDMLQGFSSASTHNILAFASKQGILRLWDIRKWEVVHTSTFDGMQAYSLRLTSDLKFITIAGVGAGDRCVVLQLK